MTSPKMMEYQYKELIAQLNLVQLHAEDPRCPCTFSAGDLNEFCIPKHLLTIAALASESASMEDNKANKKLLFGIQEEAAQLHEDTKKTIVCKKGPFTPGIEDWARKARKSLEPIYYACGVKTEAKREKAKVADPGHTLTADNVISHVKFEPNREKVVAAYIGPHRQVLGVNTVATGTAHSAPLPVDKVVREANAHQAKGIVLMHNHPSGTTEISQDDQDATRILREAASPLWVEHHIQGDTVAKVAEGSPATDITIRGRCKGKPSTCSIAVKGAETVTKSAPSPASLKRTIEEVEADMKARRGVPPNPNTFAIGPSLTKYQFRFEVLEADQLVVSHNFKTFADTPGYPPDLQPRLRTRAAQVLQVQTIAATLNPDSLLVDFKSIEKGAPIIGKSDNVVECGNGRVMALQLSAENHPDKFGAYKAALVKLAPAYGIPAATVEKMKAPVLVKRRLSDTDRASFAQECNASTTIAPSAIETARTDAKLITMENIISLDIAEGQGIEQALRSPKNKAFTTSFLSKLPKNDQARLVDKDGQLNQEGVRRMTLALFLAAFHGDGGLRLAERSFEETEESVKNVLNGILRALGMLARSEQMAASGQRAPGLSISEDLAKTVAVYGQIKNTPGMTVAKYLAQSQMLERQLNPFQERLLSEIDKRARSAKAIGAMLNLYALNVEQAPPPQQGGMMGMEITVTKDDLFSKALRTLAEEEAAETADKAAREARRQGKTLLEVSEPRSLLTRQKGETKDSHGCQLHYIVYTVRAATGDILERTYADAYGFGVTAKTLDDLKNKMGNYKPEVSEPVKVGDMVTLLQPTLQGPKKRMGRVTRIMPDGKVEVKLQQGGYDVAAMSEVTTVSEPLLKRSLAPCNLTDEQITSIEYFRPLRDFILWAEGYGKVQVCQAGIVEGVYQVTVRPRKTEDAEKISKHALARFGLKEVAVFGSKDRVFTVTMPNQTVEPSELLGGKQYVTAGHIHQAGEQPKLFERNPNPTITIAGRCKGAAGCKLTVKATEAIAAGATPGDLTKAIAQVQRRWSEEGNGLELARVAEDVIDITTHRFPDMYPPDDTPGLPEPNARNITGQGRITVTFPYDPALVAEIKERVPGIQWNPDGKNWVLRPLQQTKESLQALAYFSHKHGFGWAKIANDLVNEKAKQLETGKPGVSEPTRCRVIHQHDDGDQTLRCKEGTFVKTTDGKLFKQVREPNVRDPLLAAVVSKACGLGLCVAEPKGKK